MSEKRVMTEELRRQLAGHIGFSNNSTIEFPPQEYLRKDENGKCETPEDLIGYFPTFVVRGFTKEEKRVYDAIIKDAVADKENKAVDELQEKMKALVRPCISNVKNNYDIGTLKVIPFKGDAATGIDPEQFEHFNMGIVRDIFHFIAKISLLSVGEKLSLK